jgi:hypothetical protein
MCRRWSAGPFFAVPCGDTVEFEKTGALTYFRSSQWGERGFCADCGTSLIWKLHDNDDLNVSAQAFDEADEFAFGAELFVDEKPGNYAFGNDTKKLTGAEIMAAFMNEAKDAS